MSTEAIVSLVLAFLNVACVGLNTIHLLSKSRATVMLFFVLTALNSAGAVVCFNAFLKEMGVL